MTGTERDALCSIQVSVPRIIESDGGKPNRGRVEGALQVAGAPFHLVRLLRAGLGTGSGFRLPTRFVGTAASAGRPSRCMSIHAAAARAL